jgi:protein FAM32A
MPASEYTASSGTLKFKGAGISKPKKKKRAKPTEPDAPPSSSSALSTSASHASDGAAQKQTTTGTGDEDEGVVDAPGAGAGAALQKQAEKERGLPLKTEAERRFEEKRRRRLEERVGREGGKTHKEKVEELNRYLSGLSEHHDMYVLLFIETALLLTCRAGRESDLDNEGRARLRRWRLAVGFMWLIVFGWYCRLREPAMEETNFFSKHQMGDRRR